MEQQGSRKVLESCLPRWNVAATRKTDKPYCELSRTGDSRGQGPPEWGRGPALPPGPGQMTGGQDDLPTEFWYMGLSRSLSLAQEGTL